MKLNKIFLINLLSFLQIAVFVFSFISILDDVYLFDLFSNFRFQYLICSLMSFSFFLLLKKIKFVFLSITVVLVNLYFLYPCWINNEEVVDRDLRVLFSNILSSNKKYLNFINLIKKENPDIIVIQEATSIWIDQLAEIEESYPFSIKRAEIGNFGLAIYSKIPILKKDDFILKLNIPAIFFQVKINEKIVSFFTTHFIPPIGKEYWQIRTKHFEKSAEILNLLEGEKIFLGDLNTVTWSSQIKLLEKRTQMTTLKTFKDSWCSLFPPGFRIKIDHTLISSGLMANQQILENFGSDHFPIRIDIKIK